MENLVTPSFWKDKRVFLTGHTGFKGSWMSYALINFGAKVTGYSLTPPTDPNLFTIAGIEKRMTSVISDIRDFDALYESFSKASPEIVIHMAAQPIVMDGYKRPLYTYETNVMGTVNILECVRSSNCVKSFLNITTDKVYKNYEWQRGYSETDQLDGYDPYSNSKSCSELATHCYNCSFLKDQGVPVSTVRSGNVIGGGDFSKYRVIPDCIRAIRDNKTIIIRNPNSIRPYQHVLEPVFAYLMIAEKQYCDDKYADCYNVGPDECESISTEALADLLCAAWGDGARWQNVKEESGPHESGVLKLDCSKIKSVFSWNPVWNINKAVDKTVEWTKAWMHNTNTNEIMSQQIKEYLQDCKR